MLKTARTKRTCCTAAGWKAEGGWYVWWPCLTRTARFLGASLRESSSECVTDGAACAPSCCASCRSAEAMESQSPTAVLCFVYHRTQYDMHM